jgi:HSP20 family protein
MVDEPPRRKPVRPENQLPEDMQFLDSDPVYWRLASRAPAWRPPTDVYEMEDAIIVRVEIAGMRDDDFIIELDGRSLTIRGTRLDVSERRAYHQMEIRFGEFSSEVELPVPIIAAEVAAEYSNGLLRVVLPKARARKIHVVE